MAYLVHDLGFELPVYDREAIVEIPRNAGKLGTETFLRDAGFKKQLLTEIGSLKRMLELADTAFKYTAENLGGVVVWHQWGLQPAEPIEIMQRHELLPAGHNLIAEVEVITQTDGLGLQRSEEIHKYGLSFTHLLGVDGYQWTDFKPRNFMVGISRSQPTPVLQLSDIDPLLTAVDSSKIAAWTPPRHLGIAKEVMASNA